MIDNDKEEINRVTGEMISSMESRVGKEIAISLVPKILSKIKFKDEEQLIRVNNSIRIASNTIQDRIHRNTMTRMHNLINTFEESYATSKDLLDKMRNSNLALSNDSVNKVNKKKVKKVA